jgi:two-component system cell cycle sensor histidine kinase PleC
VAVKANKKSGKRPRGKNGALSDQARVALSLVIVFAVAFISVIGLKLYQERREMVRIAEASQARSAAFLAERASARLARAQGAVFGVAAAVEAAGGDPVAAGLPALASQPLIADAGVLSPDGAAAGAQTPARLAQAWSERAGRAIWVSGSPSNRGLFVYAPLAATGGESALVAEIDVDAVAPGVAEARVLALVDVEGQVLTANGAPGGPARGAHIREAYGARVAALGGAGQTLGAVIDSERFGEQPLLVGVAPIGGSELTVVLTGGLTLPDAAWRSIVVFYLLLLVAPILVSVGLCAVLLMQMESIRKARAALQDQERRFRLAIENARCGVWEWNLEDNTVFVTDSLARMLGRKGAANLTASEFLSLIREQDQEKLRQALEESPVSGELDVEFRAYSLPVWLHARGRPWSGPDEAPSSRVVGVAIDVTEQKGAQARINAAETRLRAALESVGECFVLWDARRRLVLSNQKYREFFDLDAKLVKPGAAYEMLELASHSAIKETHAADEDGSRELELKDGRWIHFSERRTNDGGLVSIGTDITALKRQEEMLIDKERQAREMVAVLRESQDRIAELARSYEQEKIRAEEASRSKSEFLANMSHELRTPLNAINGFSEIMIQEMFGPIGDARYKEYVNDILSSGQHLLALINDILDMSKIEAGKMQLSIEDVKPNELAEQSERLVRGRAREAELDLVCDVSPLPEIQGDPRAIKQVLINLLTNAVKFTPAGGRVLLEGRALSQSVRFRVIDTGIGISEENLARIGKPFEQIESQQSKTHKGSGLGLALSRSLAEMHGGSLTIESELGKGTTVTVEFPLVARFRAPEDEVPANDAREPEKVLEAT